MYLKLPGILCVSWYDYLLSLETDIVMTFCWGFNLFRGIHHSLRVGTTIPRRKNSISHFLHLTRVSSLSSGIYGAKAVEARALLRPPAQRPKLLLRPLPLNIAKQRHLCHIWTVPSFNFRQKYKSPWWHRLTQETCAIWITLREIAEVSILLWAVNPDPTPSIQLSIHTRHKKTPWLFTPSKG